MRVPNKDNSYLITGLIPGVTYSVEVYAAISGFQSEPDSIEATTGMEETKYQLGMNHYMSGTLPANRIVPVLCREDRDGHAQ